MPPRSPRTTKAAKRRVQPQPLRQIHLDFHTSPHIPDVGVDFDPERFAQTFVDAHVQSVTLFAKCHHGLLYFDTDRPERHPSMPASLHLMDEQVAALRAVGVRTPLYLSLGVDELAAAEHPEWLARGPDGAPIYKDRTRTPFDASWHCLDVETPYGDYFLDQLDAVLDHFKPVDGIFLDMTWDQPSCSNAAIASMLDKGLDPTHDIDRATHAHDVMRAYLAECARRILASSPDAGIWCNSREMHDLHNELHLHRQIEIESLPTGGWGYLYFPKWARFARTLGRPCIGQTARFHRSWGDFGGIKPQAALDFETRRMAAAGACVAVGDQLHPRGTLDPAAYRMIGRAFADLEAIEPWLDGATPVTEVALVASDPRHGKSADDGAVRLLLQLRQQFDVVTADHDFDGYDLVVVPEDATLHESMVRRLAASDAPALLIALPQNSDVDANLATALGVDVGDKRPGRASYFRVARDVDARVEGADHVLYTGGRVMRARRGTSTLAKYVAPYFDRTWQHFSSHAQTPPERVTRDALATQRDRRIAISAPIFEQYRDHGAWPVRHLLASCIDRLLPEPRVRAGGPTGLEASLLKQRGRHVLHLLYAPVERRGRDLDLIDDVVPLHDVDVSVRLPKRPKRVTLEPSGEAIDFTFDAGRATFVVPRVEGHALVCLA